MSFKKTVNLLSDGECLPVNCRISGDKLIPALSPEKLANTGVPQGIIFAAYSECVKDFFLCTDADIHTSTYGNNFTRITGLTTGTPFMFEDIADGAPRAVLVCGLNAIYKKGGRYDAFYNYGANLSCGVMHCGRLFGADGTDPYKLRWSGAGGLTDWEEGIDGSGSLTLDPARGGILDIAEFGEKLVLVRKYGLTVLSMYGSPENFAVNITDTGSDEIYRGTAQVAGGKLIFCTASGLHSFDGSVIRELPCGYARDISNPVCSAELGGKYFLSCTVKSLNGAAVLCCDPFGGESYLIDISADALCSAGRIYAYNSSGAFRLEEGGGYSLTAGKINFGSGRMKTVTEIFIDGEADVEISNGRVVRKFTGVKGRIRPALRGEEFAFKITGTEPVRKITATAEECDAI